MKRLILVGSAAVISSLLGCSDTAASRYAGRYDLDVDATITESGKSLGIAAMPQLQLAKAASLGGYLDLRADRSFQSALGKSAVVTSRGTWSVDGLAIRFVQSHVGEQTRADATEGTIRDGVVTIPRDIAGLKLSVVYRKAPR